MPKFYYNDMELQVPEGVYYPREDSLLIAKTIENMNIDGKQALEIGCGSGFLSILMARKGSGVTAVDINDKAVETTKENAAATGAKINVFWSDLFSKVVGSFDLIVFNPPYLQAEEDDLTYSGGKNGRDVISRFIEQAPMHLNHNGSIIVVISSLTGEKEVIELFKKSRMKCEIISREKIPWEELIVLRASVI